MAAWAGFSDEELQKMHQKTDNLPAAQGVPAALGRGRKTASANRSRQQLQREKALQLAAQQMDCVGSLPPEQKLIKPQLHPVPNQPATLQSAPSAPSDLEEKKPSAPETSQSDSERPETPPVVVVKELEKHEVELREKSRWEQLQWEQRVMEEKNKKRKALLAKAIAEKSKQTQAEAVKLKKIQKELQALDDSVSGDVSILRKLIDHASMEYSIAWKRFEKAEAEYVTAKLDLHKRTEVKEQLTEHLCAIIQQNELRKALKLEELMLQLELQADEEPCESPDPQVPEEGKGEAASQTVNRPMLDNGVAANQESSMTENNITQDSHENKTVSAPTDEAAQSPPS